MKNEGGSGAMSNQQWISVEEKLPPEDREVLIFDGTCMYVAFSPFCDEFRFSCCGQRTKVTHWMPLPEPPQEATGHE